MTQSAIALAADPAGFELKNALRAVLDQHGMAARPAQALRVGGALLVCRTEIRISIAANRHAGVARDCLPAFLTTPFAGGRHARRVAKLHQVAETAPMSELSPEVAV